MTPGPTSSHPAEISVGSLLSALDAIDDLHAMTQVRPEVLRTDAQAAPDGPLGGLAYVAKDIVDAVGYATTGGTPALRDATPPRDATVIARLRSAGAALCGVVGWRPTHGRYPGDGVLPISPTRDTIGVCATTVALVAAVDPVLATVAAPEPSRPGKLRIGRLVDFAGPVDRAVETAYRSALGAAQRAGHTLVDVDLTALVETTARIGTPIAVFEFLPGLAAYLRRSAPSFSLDQVGSQIASPDVRAIWDAAGDVTKAEYDAAMADRKSAIADYARVLDAAGVDVVAYPTTPVTARPIGEDRSIELRGGRAGTFVTYTRFCHLAGVLGHPAISLPAGLDGDGLPIGLELAGRVGQDANLLAAAAAIESLLPPRPTPPTSAAA